MNVQHVVQLKVNYEPFNVCLMALCRTIMSVGDWYLRDFECVWNTWLGA